MNTRQFSSIAAGLLLLAASCKKADTLHQQPAAPAENKVAANAAAPAANAWTKVGDWSSNKQEGFTTFNTQIKDESITSAVISKGLVLVYLNTGNGIVSLPFQQKEGGNAFWYYQLSKGGLQINVDAYTAATPATGNVQYFVITPEKLQSLQQQGHSKKELLTLTYENAAALLR